MANKIRIKCPAARTGRTERKDSSPIPPSAFGTDNSESPAKRIKRSVSKKTVEPIGHVAAPADKPIHNGKPVTVVPLPAYANHQFKAKAATAAPASTTTSSPRSGSGPGSGSRSRSSSGSSATTPDTGASSPTVFSAKPIANEMGEPNDTKPAQDMDQMALACVVDKFPCKAKKWSFKIKNPIATGGDPMDLDNFFAAHALLGLSRAQ